MPSFSNASVTSRSTTIVKHVGSSYTADMLPHLEVLIAAKWSNIHDVITPEGFRISGSFWSTCLARCQATSLFPLLSGQSRGCSYKYPHAHLIPGSECGPALRKTRAQGTCQCPIARKRHSVGQKLGNECVRYDHELVCCHWLKCVNGDNGRAHTEGLKAANKSWLAEQQMQSAHSTTKISCKCR